MLILRSAAILIVMIVAMARAFASEPVGRLFALDSNMIRGAAPGNRGELEFLRDQGIRTVISFDSHQPDFASAESLGMHYVHIPIGYGSVPAGAELDFLAVLHNSATPPPYFIHCHGGKYRVGAMAAIYRMQTQGWSPDSALQEMLRLGGKTNYPGLNASVLRFRPVGEKAILAHAFNPFAPSPVPALEKRMVEINKAFREIKKYVAAGMERDEMAGLALGLEELYFETYRLRLCRQCDSTGYGLFLKAAQAIQKRRLGRDFTGEWVRELQQDCKQCHANYRH